MQSFNKASMKSLLRKQRSSNGSLISLLQAVQDAFGYLPKAALQQISADLGIPLSRLYSIATFYDSFELAPQGRNTLNVCLGTACHVKGGENLADMLGRELALDECEGTTADQDFSLKKVRCLGCCSMAPVMKVNDDIHGSMTQTKIVRLLKQYRKGRKR